MLREAVGPRSLGRKPICGAYLRYRKRPGEDRWFPVLLPCDTYGCVVCGPRKAYWIGQALQGTGRLWLVTLTVGASYTGEDKRETLRFRRWYEALRKREPWFFKRFMLRATERGDGNNRIHHHLAISMPKHWDYRRVRRWFQKRWRFGWVLLREGDGSVAHYLAGYLAVGKLTIGFNSMNSALSAEVRRLKSLYVLRRPSAREERAALFRAWDDACLGDLFRNVRLVNYLLARYTTLWRDASGGDPLEEARRAFREEVLQFRRFLRGGHPPDFWDRWNVEYGPYVRVGAIAVLREKLDGAYTVGRLTGFA